MASSPSFDDSAVDPAHAMASIRGELARLHSGLSRIEAQLSALERDQREVRVRERPERYLRVLVDVYERGGRHGVGAGEFGAIGAEHGYDRRGLGGFFTGGRAPLRRAEGRIALTPYGERLVDVYLEQLRR